jgi:hypothetical protein
VRKITWGAPYEQTGLEKYLCYEKKYLSAISSQKEKCLGSYVFYWNGFKQETTYTLFCMFDSTGLESLLVGMMHRMWTGEKLKNEAPLVDSLNIGNYVRYQQIVLNKGSVQSAMVTAHDSNNDRLVYKWEIRPEAKYASYAGQGEVVPAKILNLITLHSDRISFSTPSGSGAYRLFVYVNDGNGHFPTGNLPFYVK